MGRLARIFKLTAVITLVLAGSCATTATNVGKNIAFSSQNPNGLLLAQFEFDHEPPYSYIVTIAPYDVETDTTGEPFNLGFTATDAFGFRAMSEFRKSTVKRHHLIELPRGDYIIERVNRWHTQVSATTIFCSTRKFTILPGKVNNVGDVGISFSGNRAQILYVRPPEASEAKTHLSGYSSISADLLSVELIAIERAVVPADKGEVNADGLACQ